jgi:hypothetical protein
VRIIGREVRLGEGLLIDVSGPAGGGTVLAGGELQGQRNGAFGADQSNAQTLWMDASAQIRADATGLGQGGTVILWADDTARIHGRISARGGPEGGDGGFIETSGKRLLEVTQPADAGASKGKAGTWLLDPTDVTIDNGTQNTLTLSGTVYSPAGAVSSSIINAGVIETALSNGTDVTISTANPSGTGAGDITVAGTIQPLTATGSPTLTLQADRHINVQSSISKATGGTLNLVLQHGSISSAGTIGLSGAFIDLGNGSLTASAAGALAGSGTIVVTNGFSSVSAGPLTASRLTVSGGELSLASSGVNAQDAQVAQVDLGAFGTLTLGNGGSLSVTDGTSLLSSSKLKLNGGTFNPRCQDLPARRCRAPQPEAPAAERRFPGGHRDRCNRRQSQ